MSGYLSRGAGMRVFACLASGYVMSYALRSVNAAIAPELVSAFGLSNAALGSLSSAYFFAFAAMQLPLGIWLDRFGSRRTDATLLCVAACGCAIFASAAGTTQLWVGRALIGAGVSGALMSSLRAYRFWFEPRRQPQLVAWMLVAGTLGALAATVPVRMALGAVGWRGVFWLAAALLVAAAAAIWFGLPRDERTHAGGAADSWRGYATVFRDPYFWRFAGFAVVVHASFVAFQSLWVGPWFTEVLGMSPAAAARALFVFNLLLMFGFLGLGAIAPRIERAGWTMLRQASVSGGLVVALHAWITFASGTWVVALWIAYAVVATVFTLMQSHVSLSFPEALTGRAYTAYNLLIFGGMFGAQALFGVFVDVAGSFVTTQSAAFRVAMGAWTAIELIALAWLLLSRASPRQ